MSAIAGYVYSVSVWLIPVILAITLHEASHGFVALRFGDDTALREGRVTFNPIRHIDPFGTIILPIMLLLATNGAMTFGAAKPVPVNFARLRPWRLGVVAVAFAGPGSNLILAFASAILLHLAAPSSGAISEWMVNALIASMTINLILFFFNLIPIPPLDGGRILVAILPGNLARPVARLERAGFIIILGALFLLPLLGSQLGVDLNVFQWIIGIPAFETMKWIVDLVGPR
jgi:Zn-dependent protease